MRKPVFGVSNQVPKKLGCTTPEDGYRCQISDLGSRLFYNRKVPKFSDARKHCCNLPKIKTKMPNIREFHQKSANGIANSKDHDQTAPQGAV